MKTSKWISFPRVSFSSLRLTLIERPQEAVFEEGVKNMNDFLEQINKFEKITNARLIDLWRIKDTAFSPLKVSIDIQEYMPGLFDLLKPE